MPLPSDDKLLRLAEQLLAEFDAAFGVHPGFRPAHAKGILLTGSFTPSSEAATLTGAPHALRESTPVTVRFSDSTGLPTIPDFDANASPRGMAIRFHLAEHVHTDIIGHSTDGFPARTGEEFLELMRAAAASGPGSATPPPIALFVQNHPAAMVYLKTPRPAQASFATERYFGLTAMRFTNADGTSRYGRYRMIPRAGLRYIDDATAKNMGADYLFDEIRRRVAAGPVGFDVRVQIAATGDTVDDVTVHWPEDRPVLQFGKIELTAVAAGDAAGQKQIIFDPIPRIDGIEPSADPLLELRAAVYLLSGRRRRQAKEPGRTAAG